MSFSRVKQRVEYITRQNPLSIKPVLIFNRFFVPGWEVHLLRKWVCFYEFGAANDAIA